MSGLKQWSNDGASPEVAQLLAAGSCERPGVAGFERALLIAGVTATVSTISNVTSAASTGASSSFGAIGQVATKGLIAVAAKWSVIGMVGIGAVVGAVSTIRPHTKAPPTVAMERAKFAAARPRSAIAPVDPIAQAQSVANSSVSADPVPTSRPNRSNSPVPALSAPAAADQSIEKEIVLIDRARAALRAGQANSTLRLVDEYSRSFVKGRFAPEAQYLKMEAYVRLGKQEDASRAAKAFVDRYPRGAQVSRAKQVLGASTD